jgi:dTDP-glucose 4,6-dehydratase
MLILAWHRTHGVPFYIARPTNNYGIGQYPEKLIPKAVKYLALGKPIPLHGNGSFARNWLHVEDMVEALLVIAEKGMPNKIYNIAGNHEVPNRKVVESVLRCYFGRKVPLEKYAKLQYIRQGEDVRYSIDDSATRALGWKNRRIFDREIPKIVAYYKNKIVW